ncbi:MAG: biotin--[acetyl-CoA-carboxylase] ligase [Labilithrix sp.]|nr:biotin--[acetyl-CoA-carboxylase] ligase [Labilithrix sp.]
MSGTSPVAADLAGVADLVRARGGRLGEPIHLLAETGSTNDDARAGARAGAPHGAVWIAESQTRGRGRQGRAWVSAPGESLLFSVLLRIPCAPSRVPPLSLVCGLAVRDAVARALGERDGERALVKWPNDVVVRDRAGGGWRKVAGVLVESALAGAKVEHVIVGIGVNVHTRDFPDDLAAIATSVAREASGPPHRAELLADILDALGRDVEQVAHRGLGVVHARLSAHDALSGRAVEGVDGDLTGTACGIAPDGRLLVRRPDGVVTKVASGEVRVRAGSVVDVLGSGS